MALDLILKFLERFEVLGSHASAIEREAVRWCELEAGIGKVEVKLRRPNLTIFSKSAPARSALFTLQSRLLGDLRKKFGSKAPDRIIFG